MRRRPQGEHGVRGHTPGPPRQAFVQPRVDQARSCAYKPRNSGEGSADISRGGPRRPACPTATTISTIEPARTRSVHLPARGPGRPTLGAAPAGWASGGGVGAPSCTPGRGVDGRAAGARVGPRSLPSGPSSRCPRPAQVRLRHAGRPSRAWRGGIRGGAGRHRGCLAGGDRPSLVPPQRSRGRWHAGTSSGLPPPIFERSTTGHRNRTSRWLGTPRS